MPKESAQIRHHAVITPKLHADSKVNKKKERIEKDESYTIIMTGATGDFEKKINGTYRQCKKKKWKGKVKLYEKVGDSSICLEYYPPMKEWHVTRNVEPPLMDACCFAFLLSKKGAHIDTCWAYCPIPDDLKTNDFCLPEECVEKWRVWNGDPEHGRWETQNGIPNPSNSVKHSLTHPFSHLLHACNTPSRTRSMVHPFNTHILITRPTSCSIPRHPLTRPRITLLPTTNRCPYLIPRSSRREKELAVAKQVESRF